SAAAAVQMPMLERSPRLAGMFTARAFYGAGRGPSLSKTVQDRDPGRQDVIELNQEDQHDADDRGKDHAEQRRGGVQRLGDQDPSTHQVNHLAPALLLKE